MFPKDLACSYNLFNSKKGHYIRKAKMPSFV